MIETKKQKKTNYLVENYSTTYMLEAEIDQRTGDFCRDVNGELENYDDIWISCKSKGKIYAFDKKGLLEYYNPSIGIGHNIIKDIASNKLKNYSDYSTVNKYIDKNGIPKESTVFDYDKLYDDLEKSGLVIKLFDTDAEVIIKFNANKLDELKEFLSPKKALKKKRDIFSVKNIRKTVKNKHKISEDDLALYKEVTEKLSDTRPCTYNKINKEFLTILSKKTKTPIGDLNTKIKVSGLKFKEYVNSIGSDIWNDYIMHMRKYIK